MWYDNIVEGIVDDDVDRVVDLLEKNTNEMKKIITNFKLYYLFYKTKSKEMVIALLDYFDVKSIFDITLILTSIINVAIMHGMDIEIIRRLIDRGGIIDNTDIRHVSPLLQCIISKRNVNFVKEILKMGADVNEICDKHENTILHLAVSNFCIGDDIGIIKLLIESGADINVANSTREKPLIRLPLNADEDLWLQLINRMPDIDKHTEMYLLCDNFLTSVLYKTSRIKQFINIIIKKLIPKTLNKVCNRLLYLALKNNCSFDCVIEIINNGANVNELKYVNEDENDYSIPPLLMALQLNRSKDIISVLIDKGADVNAIGELGVTPLLCAINNNYDVEIIDKLLNFEADVNKCDFDRFTPLMCAIKNNDFEVICRLIKAEVDINAVDIFGRTSLHYAVVYLNDQNVINLLIKKGADFSQINDCHDRFWFNVEVVEERDDKVFAELIPNRNDINIKDEFGQTFLMYAIELNMNENIIFKIIRNGADINAIDYRGYTPLIYAIKYECDVDVIINLIEHGADVNVIDNNGLTPIKHAVHSSMFKEIIQILIDNGVNINNHDENNSTVLLYILKYINNNKEHVNFVIQNGADVNICDNQGLTPLMYGILYGAECNKIEIAAALIKNGALIDISDVEGHTALYYAFSCENIDDKCLYLLIDCGASVHKCIANLGEGKTDLIYSDSFVRNFKIMIEFLQCVKDISEADKCDTNYLNFFFTYHVELAVLFICDNIEILKNVTELIEKVINYAPSFYLRKLLFCCGLDINLLGKDNRTLISQAAYEQCNVKLIKEILENGGNPNLSDSYLCTTLHYIVFPEAINVLIIYGNADITARDNFNEITCKRVLCDLGSFNPRSVKPFTKHLLLVLPEELNMFGPVQAFYPDFLKECNIELNKMKSTNIVDNLSFFKFCCKLSEHDMKLISESDNFCVYSEKQIERLFPIYFDIIIMKIKKCKIDLSKRQLISALERLIITNKIIKSYDSKKYETDLNNCCSSVEHLDQLCECVSLNYDITYCISKYLFDRHIVNLLLASHLF